MWGEDDFCEFYRGEDVGGADCSGVVGEDLPQDVHPDGLQGPLHHLRLHPGVQALAVGLPAFCSSGAICPFAASTRPGHPVARFNVQEDLDGGGHRCWAQVQGV